MLKYKYLIISLVAGIILSCNRGEKQTQEVKVRLFPEYDVALDDIIKSKNGIIRGLELNTITDSIIKYEGKEAIEKDSTSLYYEYEINDNLNYSLTYILQGDSLEEVNVQINSNDIDLSAKIFTDLKTFYEKKLPNPTEDKGYVVYNCFEGQRKPYVVSLTDNSSPTKGIINLVIYKDK
jgi:hypothetical protein